MTFSEALSLLKSDQICQSGIAAVELAIAEQVEANRKELQDLRKDINNLDRRTVGMAKLGPR